jgi:hypothetical protein
MVLLYWILGTVVNGLFEDIANVILKCSEIQSMQCKTCGLTDRTARRILRSLESYLECRNT